MDKKTIAILSLYSHSVNYGGVLQAFALNEILKKKGFAPKQITYSYIQTGKAEKKSLSDFLKRHSLSYVIKKPFMMVTSKLPAALRPKSDGIANAGIKLRREIFDNFRKDEVAHTVHVNQNTIKEKCGNFDAYICGSDQVWNSSLINNDYMLSFAPEDKPRFSYAASIPQPSLSEDEKLKYSAWLDKLDGVSVREQNSVDLLQPLTKNKVEWVLDPTLLMTAEEWSSFAKAEPIKDKYVFCYFLGTDKKFRNTVTKFAKKKGLKVVTLPYLLPEPNKPDKKFGDIQLCDADPLNFVSLIKNAEYVFTDSFHATAFSINLHTDFFVFQRSEQRLMKSRLSSLLDMTGIENKIISSYIDILSNSDCPDWKKADIKLNEQRKISYAYLDKQLDKIK